MLTRARAVDRVSICASNPRILRRDAGAPRAGVDGPPAPGQPYRGTPMSARPRTTAERWARFQRDQETYRRISLARRTYARFRRDLAVVPARLPASWPGAHGRPDAAPRSRPRSPGQDEQGRAVALLVGAARSRAIGARRQHRHLARGQRAILIPIHLELPGDLAEDAIGTCVVVAGNRIKVDVSTIGLWVRSTEERDVIGRAAALVAGAETMTADARANQETTLIFRRTLAGARRPGEVQVQFARRAADHCQAEPASRVCQLIGAERMLFAEPGASSQTSVPRRNCRGP
jgi:hypothetical protein